ncbi:MAG: hypothetical protein LBQ12_12500 [Deltaproteobacteria bacterium]|nr:hypothetical protein [Deltaproteobacteria bacterium]
MAGASQEPGFGSHGFGEPGFGSHGFGSHGFGEPGAWGFYSGDSGFRKTGFRDPVRRGGGFR